MCAVLKAPQVKRYADWLKRVEYQNFNCQFSYDALTYKKIDELYAMLERLKPNRKNGAIELWLRAERGGIEDFGNYEEFHEAGEAETYAEFEKLWRLQFPDEVEWFNFLAIENKDINYRMIFLEHRSVIEVDSRKERSFPNDISAFAAWLVDAVADVIRQIESGTYNEMLERELPPQHRIGTISRAQLWEIWPKVKADFFAGISQENVAEFLSIGTDTLPPSTKRLPEMTANDFFRCCALGYQANNYLGTEKTPREQYRQYADGRDDGLGELPPDSPEAFSLWYHDREQHGGHPWEVCCGGNSTHIDLFVCEDELGYYFRVAGSSWVRTIEAVNFYLALHHAGQPVAIHQADKLKERLAGTEKIGIVPDGVFPSYCHSMFGDEDMIDFMNLPLENRDFFAARCVWQPVTQAHLKGEVKAADLPL